MEDYTNTTLASHWTLFTHKALLVALTDIFRKFYTDRQPNTCLRKVKWCGFYKIPILHLRTQCKTSYICWQSCRAKLVEEFLNFLILRTELYEWTRSLSSQDWRCFISNIQWFFRGSCFPNSYTYSNSIWDIVGNMWLGLWTYFLEFQKRNIMKENISWNFPFWKEGLSLGAPILYQHCIMWRWIQIRVVSFSALRLQDISFFRFCSADWNKLYYRTLLGKAKM